MNGAKKKAIVICCVVLICLVLLACSVMIAGHAHVCIGATCEFCSVIDAVQKLLAGLLFLAVASILLALTLFNVSYIQSYLKISSFFTLISQKVKLSR